MTNVLLKEFKFELDSYDPWGSALAWHFAVADTLTELAGFTPAEWEFFQSPFGVDYNAPEYQTIAELLRDVELHQRVELLVNAGNVLGRYANVCRQAGLDY